MSIPISLGSGMTLKIKYRNGRAFASVIQYGRLLGRTLPILFAPVRDPDYNVVDRREGIHVLRKTTTKVYRDSPAHVESKIVLARWDGARFLHVSPNQVGREGGALNLDQDGARFDRVILPALLKRYILSYPNAPQPPMHVLATLPLAAGKSILVCEGTQGFRILVRDEARGPLHDFQCAITKWHPLHPPPALDGIYLVRIHHDGATVYTTVRASSGGYAWPDSVPALQWPGALIEWAGVTEECHQLLRDITA